MTHPSNITDDQLSAFLDGELPDDEMSLIEQALNDHPELQKRLEQFEAVDALIAPAFDEILTEPVPEDVTSLLRGEEDAQSTTAQIISFPKARKFLSDHGVPMAAAATVALVASSIISGTTPQSPNTFAFHDRPDLVELLAQSPSGERVSLSGDQTAEVLLSYAQGEGGYCREFAIYGNTETVQAVACNESGSWAMKVAEFSQGTPSADGSYGLASSAGAALEAFVDETMAEDALDADQEAALIANGWTAQD